LNVHSIPKSARKNNAPSLEKRRARTIIALLPYLAYAHDDKRKARQSLATAWVGALLQASGVDEVITVNATILT
jgi:ribose-phosphate pyrophosphokinase